MTMHKVLREALPSVIASLMVAVLLGAIGVVGDFVGLRSSENEAALRYTISGGLFLILAASTAFVIFSRRPNIIDPSTRQFRFAQHYRLLGMILGVLELVSLAWFLWPKTFPTATIEIQNTTGSDFKLSRYAEFSIDLLTPLEPERRLTTGEAYLRPSGEFRQSGQALMIPAHGRQIVTAEILHASHYRQYLNRESAFVTVVLTGEEDKRLWFSENRIMFSTGAWRSIPFQVKIRE